MLVIEFDAIEVDHCLTCLGTWLDRGELEMIAERAKGDASAILEAIQIGKGRPVANRKCPRCGKKLNAVSLASPAGLEIDACPSGHGHWFDHGELVNLVRAHADGQTAAVAAYFAEVFRSELDTNPKDS